MDPRHRDRIAFFRVCSGRYQPGMKVLHVREDREMKIPNALTFMAQDRVIMTDAVAGDIIGIYNHGQLHIGDTLTQGEKLQFTGIPNFAPELFRAARSKDPFKAKQLQKGLQELGEEGQFGFHGRFGNILLVRSVSCNLRSLHSAWLMNTKWMHFTNLLMFPLLAGSRSLTTRLNVSSKRSRMRVLPPMSTEMRFTLQHRSTTLKPR